MTPYILVFIGACATIAADWFSKTWSLQRVWWYAVIAAMLYLASGVSFTVSLTMGKLTILNAVWSILVFVISTVMGMVLFHESTTTVQKIALGLGCISIALFAVAEAMSSGS